MAVFVFLCMLVAITNLISQMVFVQTRGFSGNVALILLYAVIAGVVYVLYQRNDQVSTLATYLIQIPVMLVGILMGTVFDPTQPAVTILLFIITLPLFILDKPWRVVLYETCSVALFIILCFAVKEYDVIKYDLVHIVGFYVATVAITLFTLADRFDALEGYDALHQASEHDELTGLKNRRALSAERETFLRTPICAGMVDIDLFKHFNDTYGHSTGDKVIQYFAHVIEEQFGHDSCYRYGGDEVLVVVRDSEPEPFQEKLECCREILSRFAVEGVDEPLRFSCGFVYGQARNMNEFIEMSELADKLLYEAKNAGRDTIIGRAYTSSTYADNSVPLG